MEDAGSLKRKLFEKSITFARKVGGDILDGKPVSLLNRLHYGFYNLTIYTPLRNALGMSKIRVAYTAGEAIGPDLFRFYRSIGVNLKQFYGQTETCAYVCLQPDGQVKYASVGVAAASIRPTTSSSSSKSKMLQMSPPSSPPLSLKLDMFVCSSEVRVLVFLDMKNENFC